MESISQVSPNDVKIFIWNAQLQTVNVCGTGHSPLKAVLINEVMKNKLLQPQQTVSQYPIVRCSKYTVQNQFYSNQDNERNQAQHDPLYPLKTMQNDKTKQLRKSPKLVYVVV